GAGRHTERSPIGGSRFRHRMGYDDDNEIGSSFRWQRILSVGFFRRWPIEPHGLHSNLPVDPRHLLLGSNERFRFYGRIVVDAQRDLQTRFLRASQSALNVKGKSSQDYT